MSTSTANDETKIDALVMRLHEISAVKFGSFVLKSGLTRYACVHLSLCLFQS